MNTGDCLNNGLWSQRQKRSFHPLWFLISVPPKCFILLTYPYEFVNMKYILLIWTYIYLQPFLCLGLVLINRIVRSFSCLGRSGRAGRSGEAITLYTEADVPFLRNIANVMVASSCEVPSWILALPKLRRKKHRPLRDPISMHKTDIE